MKKNNLIYILLFILSAQVLFAQSKFEGGVSYGVTQYYGKYTSTHPNMVYYAPNFFTANDAEELQAFLKYFFSPKMGVKFHVGYKELSMGYEAARQNFLNDNNMKYHSSVGSYTMVGAQFIYRHDLNKWLSVEPAVGANGYFTSNLGHIESSITIDTFNIALLSKNLVKSFAALSAGVTFKANIYKGIGLGVGYQYEQGFADVLTAEGPFNTPQITGDYKYTTKGSQSVIQLQLFYQFGKSPKTP